MRMLMHLSESEFFVELPANLVILEHIELQNRSNAPCVVHQFLTDPLPLMPGSYEYSPDLIPDKRNKTTTAPSRS